MCVATLLHSLLLWESEVVFMVEFLLFLIIGFMISATINVALLTVIYIIWKGLNKNTTFCFGRQCSVCYNICGNTHFSMFTSYFYYTQIIGICQTVFEIFTIICFFKYSSNRNVVGASSGTWTHTWLAHTPLKRACLPIPAYSHLCFSFYHKIYKK